MILSKCVRTSGRNVSQINCQIVVCKCNTWIANTLRGYNGKIFILAKMSFLEKILYGPFNDCRSCVSDLVRDVVSMQTKQYYLLKQYLGNNMARNKYVKERYQLSKIFGVSKGFITGKEKNHKWSNLIPHHSVYKKKTFHR